jgi:hypothetical protein
MYQERQFVYFASYEFVNSKVCTKNSDPDGNKKSIIVWFVVHCVSMFSSKGVVMLQFHSQANTTRLTGETSASFHSL